MEAAAASSLSTSSKQKVDSAHKFTWGTSGFYEAELGTQSRDRRLWAGGGAETNQNTLQDATLSGLGGKASEGVGTFAHGGRCATLGPSDHGKMQDGATRKQRPQSIASGRQKSQTKPDPRTSQALVLNNAENLQSQPTKQLPTYAMLRPGLCIDVAQSSAGKTSRNSSPEMQETHSGALCKSNRTEPCPSQSREARLQRWGPTRTSPQQNTTPNLNSLHSQCSNQPPEYSPGNAVSSRRHPHTKASCVTGIMRTSRAIEGQHELASQSITLCACSLITRVQLACVFNKLAATCLAPRSHPPGEKKSDGRSSSAGVGKPCLKRQWR